MVLPPGTPPPPHDEQPPSSPTDSGLPGAPVPAAAYGGMDDATDLDRWPEPERARGRASARARKLAWELVQTLVLAVLIFLAVRAMAQNFRVEGSSMEPGLHDGQYLLVNKAIYFQINLDTLGKYLPFVDGGDHPQRYLFRGPRRGDVVVFRFPQDPKRDFIKRVIAVPGDTIEVVNGVVYVNNVQIREPYIQSQGRYDWGKEVVPEDQFFVLGDNRNNSYDSHTWGFVPKENIIGRAVFSYWPLDQLGGVGNTSIDLGLIRLPVPW